MITAAHHSLLGKSGQTDLSWDYETMFSVRNKYATSLSPVGRMPTLINSYSFTKFAVQTACILTENPGWCGVIGKMSTSDTQVQYWLWNPETNEWTDTGTRIDLGSSSYSPGLVVNRAGKVVFLSRYQGKVWAFNQDGSDLQYLGTTNTSYNTRFGVRLYANYDGTCTCFGEDATNGPTYTIGEDLSIVKGNNASTTYPYSYIKLPGKTVITGSTGIMSIFDESMSTKLVDNRSVSSYMSLANGLYISPFTRNLVLYGMQTKNKFGVSVDSPYSDYRPSLKSGAQYVDGNGRGAYLPTGEYFWFHAYHANTHVICHRLFDENNRTIMDLNVVSGTDAASHHICVLPTGRYIERHSSGTTHTVKVWDFGFNKKYFCPALCVSPYGYNGGQKYFIW